MSLRLSIRIFAGALLALAAGVPVSAQTRVSGTVRKAGTGEPVENAFVVGLSGTRQKAFAYSDKDGGFSLAPADGLDALRISRMGFAPLTHPLRPQDMTGLVIELTEERMELREVKVTARAVEETGDTLSFLAGAFKDGMERSVGDLLKKLPDITVTASGGIQHKGIPIGKLYVEGMDLMGSRYGVVTQNLSADAIARIEVYQNHQPVRVLNDIVLTDKSSVNLILKENARNSWLLSGDAALGFPAFPLFEARTMLSRFGKKGQSLFLLKGNNDGGDILQELQEQAVLGREAGAYVVTPGEIDIDLRSRLHPSRSFLPLPKSYWYDNLSGFGTFNHLIKIDDTQQLRLSGQAAAERFGQISESRDEIRFADGTTLEIIENQNMADRLGYFSASVAYENNSDRRYVNNAFSAVGQLRASQSELTGGEQPYTQHYGLPSFKADNRLKIVLPRSSRSVLELSSDSRYRNMHHEARYATGGRTYGQKLSGEDFVTDFQLSRNRVIGSHRFRLSGGAALEYVDRKAEAEGIDRKDVKTAGSLSVLALRPSVRVSDAITLGMARLTLEIPATLHYLLVKGGADRVYPTVNPSLSLHWRLSRRLELSASSTYSLTRSGVESLLDAAVMQSWRTLAESDSLRQTTRWRNNATLRWSDTPAMFFASVSGSWATGSSDRSGSSVWLDNLTYQFYLPQYSVNSLWSVNGTMKKYFGLRAFSVGLQGGWIQSQRQEYLQGVPVSYRSGQLNLQLAVDSHPVWWFSTNLSSNYERNIVSGTSGARVQRFRTEATLRLSPIRPLSFEASGYWLRTEIPGMTVSNTPLLMLSVNWKLSRFTLFAECRNLLDAKEYRQETLSTYRTTRTSVQLTGRQWMVGFRM